MLILPSMDLDFNKNEDAMLLALSAMEHKGQVVEKAGGEKAVARQHEQGKMTARTGGIPCR